MINNEVIKRIKNQLNGALIVAATKYVGVAELQELYQSGINTFGENRVQDFLEKYENIDLDVNWHFIGTLQVNKVKYIIDKVSLIHSVDSLKLAKEINKQAAKHNKIMDVLLQVNISLEETKHGFTKDVIFDVVKQITDECPNIKIVGLMTMAPNIDPLKTRVVFNGLKDLQLSLQNEYKDIVELSMGMSNDYEIALEEGSTMIRVGSLLFK